MRNADTGGIATVTREQFDMLYASKGWGIVTDVDPEFASKVIGAPIVDLAELDVDQLRTVFDAYAAANQKPVDRKAELLAHKADELRQIAMDDGLDPAGTKDELADRIIEHEKSLVS